MAGEIIAAIIATAAGATAQMLYVSYTLGRSEQRITNLEREVEWIKRAHHQQFRPHGGEEGE